MKKNGDRVSQSLFSKSFAGLSEGRSPQPSLLNLPPAIHGDRLNSRYL
ncbi:MAG: hypothetical protein KME15_00510 [Drouetiella hepatica Uher 2000/2452]|uniref:Uncharacterized protein n=1 Tax=Drouetiella hepatica Uher 2000/2452 TaxID=904376 RepID=A0A951Q6Q0_9CYAN|nr:hypothetical protein [Drouetiella hepatica Uher 2000/2452]